MAIAIDQIGILKEYFNGELIATFDNETPISEVKQFFASI